LPAIVVFYHASLVTSSSRGRREVAKALVGNTLYVANTDAVMRFPYVEGDTRISQAGIKVADLPAAPLNHHWTKGLLASRDGSRLYVSVGSNSNDGKNGRDKEERRATPQRM
jgi:glucose/arabinose dehydrogenase